MVKRAATWASSVSPTVVDYGGIVLNSDETPIDRPCEDCGGLVVSGLEPRVPSPTDTPDQAANERGDALTREWMAWTRPDPLDLGSAGDRTRRPWHTLHLWPISDLTTDSWLRRACC